MAGVMHGMGRFGAIHQTLNRGTRSLRCVRDGTRGVWRANVLS